MKATDKKFKSKTYWEDSNGKMKPWGETEMLVRSWEDGRLTVDISDFGRNAERKWVHDIHLTKDEAMELVKFLQENVK